MNTISKIKYGYQLFFIIGFCIIGSCGELFAEVIDAPHTRDNGVSCGSCHTYSLWWEFSPSDLINDRDIIVIETLCNNCHDGSGSAPYAVTHSSSAMGQDMHNPDYGDWSRSCLDCHDPHFQLQLRDWLVGSSSITYDDLYLVQGTMSEISVDGETSSFDYSVTSFKPTWGDPSDWTDKTGPGRGLILVASASGQENTYEVISASGTSITVNGLIGSSSDFGLIYGQYIRQQIPVDLDRDGNFDLTDVKFFDGRGGFVTDEMDGICQVCHSQTQFFKSNSGPPYPHLNIQGPGNASTLQCTTCHAHDVAFGHGTDGGSDCVGCHNNATDFKGSGSLIISKHVEHLNLEINCSKCHDLANMSVGGSIVLDIDSTTVCSDCHHLGTGLSNTGLIGSNSPNRDDYKVGWGTATGYVFDCAGCHSIPPIYASSSSKGNSHLAHTNDEIGCEICHYSTTMDGTSIDTAGTHTNNTYNLQASGPGVTFTYSSSSGSSSSGSCSNISCHRGNDADWGQTFTCLNCHKAKDGDTDEDIEGVIDPNKVGQINMSQWETTGHGRPNTEIYLISSNSGADLTCYYCHDNTIPHGSSTTPFRLLNIGGQDGMNGVCLVCHETGAAGYDPPYPAMPNVVGSIIGSSSGIDSYHGYNEGLGGKFCWDCHDPHGDSNIYMIHDRVALRSDKDTGAPILLEQDPPVPAVSMLIDFTSNTTGADYAKVEAPFNGICNVCHLNTQHYSSRSGDPDHNPGDAACTNCHHHNGSRPDNAFSQGECLDCHDQAPPLGSDSGSIFRRDIELEYPAITESNGDAHAHFGGDLDSNDCRVCHNQIYHRDGKIRLWGGDKEVQINLQGEYENNSIIYIGDNATNIVNIDAQKYEDISDFCMSCHDSDGMNSSPYPFDPFGNGNEPPNTAIKFSGTRIQVPYDYIDDKLKIKHGSDRAGYSHHPIGHDDQFRGDPEVRFVRVECTDCHGVHSASASTKLIDPDDISRTWGTNSTDTANNFCLTCHDGGTNPHHPEVPAGVQVQVYNRTTTPGGICPEDSDLVYDCQDTCVPEYKTLPAGAPDWGYIGDGYCDDGTYGANLLCSAFNFDGGDCQLTYTADDYSGYSMIKGLETCEGYSQPPWNHDNPPWQVDPFLSMSPWSLSAHGGGTKRDWTGYKQTPQVPESEVSCIDCHDYHGSYNPSLPSHKRRGNPYMLRDNIDGRRFVDDGNIQGDSFSCSDNSTLIPPECTSAYNCDNSTTVPPGCDPLYDCDNSTGTSECTQHYYCDDDNTTVTPLYCEQFGTSGSVVIEKPYFVTKDEFGGTVHDEVTYNGWVDFCSKCHDKWADATGSGGHCLTCGYSSCLSCHAHGTIWLGEWDVYDGNDTIEAVCP